MKAIRRNMLKTKCHRLLQLELLFVPAILSAWADSCHADHGPLSLSLNTTKLLPLSVSALARLHRVLTMFTKSASARFNQTLLLIVSHTWITRLRALWGNNEAVPHISKDFFFLPCFYFILNSLQREGETYLKNRNQMDDMDKTKHKGGRRNIQSMTRYVEYTFYGCMHVIAAFAPPPSTLPHKNPEGRKYF